MRPSAHVIHHVTGADFVLLGDDGQVTDSFAGLLAFCHHQFDAEGEGVVAFFGGLVTFFGDGRRSFGGGTEFTNIVGKQF